VRQDEAHRPNDVRRGLEQNLALDQRLAHQAKLAELEIAQAPVNELAGGGGRGAREVAALHQ